LGGHDGIVPDLFRFDRPGRRDDDRTMSTIDTLQRRLAGAGLRVTAPRRRLLETMRGLGDQFSADDLLAETPDVGRATVFRTLRLFQELGVVCQVVLDDGGVAYSLSSDGHHHHLVCSNCGAVRNFASADIEEQLRELARRTGYDVATHRLELYGRCAVCREAGEAVEST